MASLNLGVVAPAPCSNAEVLKGERKIALTVKLVLSPCARFQNMKTSNARPFPSPFLLFRTRPIPPDDIPDSWCGSPNTESLKDAQARAWMFWRERVVPSMRQGKTVLICAHGNIIRAMLKRLDCIPNESLKEVRWKGRSMMCFGVCFGCAGAFGHAARTEAMLFCRYCRCLRHYFFEPPLRNM